jgi:hypothetical protein
MRHIAALLLLTACSNEPTFAPCGPNSDCPPGYGCFNPPDPGTGSFCTPYCQDAALDCDVAGVASWTVRECYGGARCALGDPGCECTPRECLAPVCSVRCTYDSDCGGSATCIAGRCAVPE